MLDNLKTYLIEVGVQKYAPMGIMAGIAWLGVFLTAHAGILEQYGITYGIWPLTWPAGQEPSGPCILLELDTLSAAKGALVIGILAIVTRALQHHTTGAQGQ